uniref:Retrotransposon gag domain-containing protein n=1 Tax=Moniliophthora roreri TaxID=221103 RepID=A0A0W0FB99_MONRR
MTDGPGEFWKNDKTDLLLAFDPEAEKVSWVDFIEDFKTSFEPLNTALEAQLKLRDLKMKERANEYTYQFAYLAKQTRYNDAAQIVAFKRGLPKSLALKIMTRPEGAPTNIKDWMNTAILFDESYKQAMEDCLDSPKKDERKKEEPKKLTKEERYAKIKALVNDQPEEEKNSDQSHGTRGFLKQRKRTMSPPPVTISHFVLAKMDQNSMHIPLQYKAGTKIIKTQALLDSGAGGRFISMALAKELGKKWIQLRENQAGKEFRENFMISGIGDENIILGLPWLRYHNSQINWETGEVKFVLKRRIQIRRFTGILDSNPMEVLIGAKITASQELAHQQQEVKKEIDKLIPPYLQRYRDRFKKKKAERFLPSRSYDHAIELKLDFVPQNCKLYPLSPNKQKEQDKFLEENL